MTIAIRSKEELTTIMLISITLCTVIVENKVLMNPEESLAAVSLSCRSQSH